MATPYQNVAKAALINWNGLSEEEAIKKIQTESVQELESQIYAMGTMKYAIIGIAKQIGLTEDETVNFFDAAISGPENAEIFGLVREKIQGFSEEQKLEVLSFIHDGWVKDNSSEKTFNKKVERQQLRQYAPLELIGWNEVKSDLLFLNPILLSVGVQINEDILSQAYYNMVANYMEKMQINNQNDLIELIEQGKNYYPILPTELNARLLPMSEVVSSQIIENWNVKNPTIARMFDVRRQQSINNGMGL